MKKRMCLCCILFYSFIYVVLLRKKQYKVNKKKCVKSIWLSRKITLDLITNLLYLKNLVDIEINREISS